jgi:lactoylglutathione lyase
MLEYLAYTVVYVNNIEESTVFYRDILGIPVDYAMEGWTQFKSQGAALVLHPKLDHQRNQATANTVHVTFCLHDLEAEYARLTGLAVHFLAPPSRTGFGKHATLVDPDGNNIDLIEWADSQRQVGVSEHTLVNEILGRLPEAIGVLEDHGIRICGGCIVLLNASVREMAEYSGLSPNETANMVEQLNQKIDMEASCKTRT